MNPRTRAACGCETPSIGGAKPSELTHASGIAEAGMDRNLGMMVAKTLERGLGARAVEELVVVDDVREDGIRQKLPPDRRRR